MINLMPKKSPFAIHWLVTKKRIFYAKEKVTGGLIPNLPVPYSSKYWAVPDLIGVIREILKIKIKKNSKI